MKDSERAKTYLGDLFTRKSGGHTYAPDQYVRADQDAIALADLMDLLAEVREDERRKYKHPGPIERLEQVFGPSHPAKPPRTSSREPKVFRDFEGDFWQEDEDNRDTVHLLRDGRPVKAKIPKEQAESGFGPLIEVFY